MYHRDVRKEHYFCIPTSVTSVALIVVCVCVLIWMVFTYETFFNRLFRTTNRNRIESNLQEFKIILNSEEKLFWESNLQPSDQVSNKTKIRFDKVLLYDFWLPLSGTIDSLQEEAFENVTNHSKISRTINCFYQNTHNLQLNFR